MQADFHKRKLTKPISQLHLPPQPTLTRHFSVILLPWKSSHKLSGQVKDNYYGVNRRDNAVTLQHNRCIDNIKPWGVRLSPRALELRTSFCLLLSLIEPKPRAAAEAGIIWRLFNRSNLCASQQPRREGNSRVAPSFSAQCCLFKQSNSQLEPGASSIRGASESTALQSRALLPPGSARWNTFGFTITDNYEKLWAITCPILILNIQTKLRDSPPVSGPLMYGLPSLSSENSHTLYALNSPTARRESGYIMLRLYSS